MTKPGTFQKGNPGRVKGSRNKVTQIAEQMINGETGEIIREGIERAKAGDPICIKLCWDRIYPAPKGRTIHLKMPQLKTVTDISNAMMTVVHEMAKGNITPDEAAQAAGVVELRRRALETMELEERIRKLEEDRK